MIFDLLEGDLRALYHQLGNAVEALVATKA